MRGKKGGADKPITKDQVGKMLMEINSLMAKTKQSLQNMNDSDRMARRRESPVPGSAIGHHRSGGSAIELSVIMGKKR